MSAYANASELRATASRYGLPVSVFDADADWLLDQATRDVNGYLGADYSDAVDLLPEQSAALRDATVAQACFRAVQGHDVMLGADDGVSAIGPVSFSMRAVARLSPEVPVILANLGLYARSGTVPPEDAAA